MYVFRFFYSRGLWFISNHRCRQSARSTDQTFEWWVVSLLFFTIIFYNFNNKIIKVLLCTNQIYFSDVDTLESNLYQIQSDSSNLQSLLPALNQSITAAKENLTHLLNCTLMPPTSNCTQILKHVQYLTFDADMSSVIFSFVYYLYWILNWCCISK